MFKFLRKNISSNADVEIKQNIFDNDTFFEGYRKMRDSDTNYNDLLEQPAMRKLLPNLLGKSILDLGCGYGHNCVEFVKNGASKVIGIDISEKMLAVAKKAQMKKSPISI